MKRLIEFPLQDGSSMIVEVDEPETSGTVTRASAAGRITGTTCLTSTSTRPAAPRLLPPAPI
jgi:hypothetical protein